VCLYHIINTQFSNYFQDNYIPHFNSCQQFKKFSAGLKVIFGAMHTLEYRFLYILSTAQKLLFFHKLRFDEFFIIFNKNR